MIFHSKLLKLGYGLDISGEVREDVQKNHRDVPNDKTNHGQEAMALQHELNDKAKKESGEPQRRMPSRGAE